MADQEVDQNLQVFKIKRLIRNLEKARGNGTSMISDEGKEKKVTIDFEPFKPINTSLYLCDNKFHREALSDLLTDDYRFGFIVMDGNGAVFTNLTGNTRDIIQGTKTINWLFRIM